MHGDRPSVGQCPLRRPQNNAAKSARGAPMTTPPTLPTARPRTRSPVLGPPVRSGDSSSAQTGGTTQAPCGPGPPTLAGTRTRVILLVIRGRVTYREGEV